jgi:hypothetical protein
VAGLAIYLVLPKLIAVFGAWPRLSTLNPVWFAVALAAELLSFTCNFALQKGRRPACSSGTATAGRSSGAPRQTCRTSRRLARRFPRRRAAITRAGS